MRKTQSTKRRRISPRAVRRSLNQGQAFSRDRLALETLEPRQMLSGTPAAATFYVVDDSAANISYHYAADGTSQGSATLNVGDAAPRGVASAVGANQTWVIDANRNVYVYDTGGALAGSWSAGSLASNATPEGIATDGNDIWVVDSKSDKVFRYAGAASRLSGSQSAASSFGLNSSDTNPKDIVTDGAALWTVDDGSKTDKVFKYSLTGSLLGSWTIDSANKAPTGITLESENVSDIWITDSGTDSVFRYTAAASRTSGSQNAAANFHVANGNSQGIAVAHSWVRQLGSAGADTGGGVWADSQGNVYMAGNTSGSLGGPNAGDADSFLAKYDAAGNLKWTKQLGTSAYDVSDGPAVDGQGNVFIPGITAGSLGGPNAGLNDAFVAKYDADGNLQWTRQLGTAGDEAAVGSAADAAGNVYISGFTNGNLAGTNAGNYDIFVAKYDANGNLQWTKQLGTSAYENSRGAAVDSLGNVYVSGYTAGSLGGPNAGSYDAFLAKYDSAGNLQWVKQTGTTGVDGIRGVSTDQLGNIYVGGFTSGSLGGPNAGGYDAFVAKFDAAGNLQWTKQLGTSAEDQETGVSADGLGNVYISGYTYGSLGGPNAGDRDAFLAEYDAAGNLVWLKQFGTSAYDESRGVSADGLGNVYSAGFTYGSLGGANAGYWDAMLIKFSSRSATAGANLATVKTVSPQLSARGSTGSGSIQNSAVAGATNIQSSTDAAQKLSLLQAVCKSEISKAPASQFSTSCHAVDAAITEGIGRKWSELLDEVLKSVS